MRKEAVIPKTSELHAYERPTLYQKIWVSENLAPQIETDARGGATQESLAAPRTRPRLDEAFTSRQGINSARLTGQCTRLGVPRETLRRPLLPL